MLLELIIALFVGILIGSITGLTPGIHINLVTVFLLSSSVFLLQLTSPLVLVVFIVSMSITHTFIDFIPSILLGAPDTDTSLSVLPGHEFLLEGKGYEAIVYTALGGSIGILIILLFTPIFILLLPEIFKYLKFVMFLVLILAAGYMILRDKNKILAFFIFLLSGFLGIASINLHLSQSLLPLLTGLFGASSLITSIAKKQKLPEQKVKLKEVKVSKKEVGRVFLASVISSPLCSFLPALGSSQAAVIGSDILEKTGKKEFLMLLGSVNTIVLGLSFVTLFSINKARTGAAAAVSELILVSFSHLAIIILVLIISGIIAFILTIFLAKRFTKVIYKLNYQLISIIVLIFLAIIILAFSGFLGFLLFLVSTFTGLTAILAGVRRTNLMGSMMIPSILFYLPTI